MVLLLFSSKSTDKKIVPALRKFTTAEVIEVYKGVFDNNSLKLRKKFLRSPLIAALFEEFGKKALQAFWKDYLSCHKKAAGSRPAEVIRQERHANRDKVQDILMSELNASGIFI